MVSTSNMISSQQFANLIIQLVAAGFGVVIVYLELTSRSRLKRRMAIVLFLACIPPITVLAVTIRQVTGDGHRLLDLVGGILYSIFFASLVAPVARTIRESRLRYRQRGDPNGLPQRRK